jgi:phosphatidyl-N-methylethanolamine N-methyltransferase
LVFLLAAALLSLERICYVWVWRFPESFRAVCRGALGSVLGEPVDALRRVFYGFKSLQLLVFVGWCYIYGNGSVWPASSGLLPPLTGLLLIAIGQVFNLGVFVQLGNKGVFYGNRFGFEIPWNESFPFSVLKHPQYVGAVLSIWGFFIAMRFPRADWFLIPVLETVYYLLGAHFEQ